MGMQVGGAIGDGVIHAHMTFEPLVQVPGLRNVNWNPTPIFRLPRVDEIAGQRPEGNVQGINCVLIFLSGLSGPIHMRWGRGLDMPVMTK
jgi:hypothetical protein